ncbi:tetratricopeptide repeat protein [Streptomyces sp. MNU76]|uniref:tetratricopeptide repeat protein n=1 Tax=Streptomyces sp. MNU76 TaxID=2560026 RepID=UPI001E644F8B|nr:tetratricopeptide repeat protein [Streptomyces sp. MNU76]MCC9711757.1 tetratricopeptide repeat protein [Streptomyces sp. MNU76]
MLFAAGAYTLHHALSQHLLQTQTCVLGADHPDTLASRSNLARALDRMGEYARRSSCTDSPSTTASASWARTTPTP